MRQLKREVKIGNVTIGGKNPVAVQTMLNVPVEDIEGNVAQAKRCEGWAKKPPTRHRGRRPNTMPVGTAQSGWQWQGPLPVDCWLYFL